MQRGFEPVDWKPLKNIGAGVREIRIHIQGQWRIIYLASRNEAIFILHAFQKKSQRTRKQDIDIARQRLKQIAAQT